MSDKSQWDEWLAEQLGDESISAEVFDTIVVELSRPHPAPIGVRVVSYEDARHLLHRAYLAGREGIGYDAEANQLFGAMERLNPQPGAEPLLSGDQAGVSNGCGVVGGDHAEGLAQSLEQMMEWEWDLCKEGMPEDCVEILRLSAAALRTLANPSKEPQK